MSLDHFMITVPAAKYEPLIEWCKASFKHLGFQEKTRPIPAVAGFGTSDKTWFWISSLPLEGIEPHAMDIFLKTKHICLEGSKYFVLGK